jgi:hypothetical protein
MPRFRNTWPLKLSPPCPCRSRDTTFFVPVMSISAPEARGLSFSEAGLRRSHRPRRAQHEGLLPPRGTNLLAGKPAGRGASFSDASDPAPDMDAIGPACRGQTPVHRPHKTDQ